METKNVVKMRKVLVTMIICLSLILGSMVTGTTIAWLTHVSGPIKNTFTPSDITIRLEESEQLDLKMVPGQEIKKDPKVTVKKDSEACWLFVNLEKSENYGEFLQDYAMSEGWKELEGVPGVYYREVDAKSEDQSFDIIGYKKTNGESDEFVPDKLLVRDTVTKQAMNKLLKVDDYPTLTITAYACQRAGFDSAEAAWDVAKAADPVAADSQS